MLMACVECEGKAPRRGTRFASFCIYRHLAPKGAVQLLFSELKMAVNQVAFVPEGPDVDGMC